MTPAQTSGVVRTALAWAFGYLAAKGFFPTGWVDGAVGVGGVVVVAVWSYYSNALKGLLDQASKSDEVTSVVVTTPELATSIPSDKVTTG